MFNRSKYLARLSLVIMGIGFVSAIPFQDTLMGKLLQGGFEAGIVGGLADWFAVTALFRHPLGLPIPHTALLSKNRDRMIKALVSAIENNWLTKESIQEKLKQIPITKKVISFVESSLYSESVKRGIQSSLMYIIKHVKIEGFLPVIERYVKAYLTSVDLSVLLRKMVGHTLDRKYDEKLLDRLLAMIEDWLKKENRSYQLGRVSLQALDQMEFDGFLQFAIKSFRSMMSQEKLGNIIQSLISGGIESIKQNDNANRLALLSYIRKELQGISENENLLIEIENFKNQLITDWEPADLIHSNLIKLKQICMEKVEDRKLIDGSLLPYLEGLLNSIQNDQEKVQKIETFVQSQIAHVIDDNHSKIGKLVQENLDKLDNEALIEIMENNIGKDLQWIRVNGAVCGFIIGIGITVLKLFL